jgi:hypothetical protein
MEKTIREIIRDYQNEMLNNDLLPQRAVEILNSVSALYGNILDQIKDTEIVYNKILLKNYETEKTANRAKIKSEISPEYQNYREAINTEKLLKKMISSLNRCIDLKKEEMRNLRYQ